MKAEQRQRDRGFWWSHHQHEQHYKVNYDFRYLTTTKFPHQLVHVSFTFWWRFKRKTTLPTALSKESNIWLRIYNSSSNTLWLQIPLHHLRIYLRIKTNKSNSPHLSLRPVLREKSLAMRRKLSLKYVNDHYGELFYSHFNHWWYSHKHEEQTVQSTKHLKASFECLQSTRWSTLYLIMLTLIVYLMC